METAIGQTASYIIYFYHFSIPNKELMPFKIDIPLVGGSTSTTIVNAGDVVYVLGANGSGKSSLMHHICINHPNSSRWISAHRQNWFASETISMSHQARREVEQSMSSTNNSEEARWRDYGSSRRVESAIFDVIESSNRVGREFLEASRQGDESRAESLKRLELPIDSINQLLELSNIPIAISLGGEGQMVASNRGGSTYSLARLSDGERNAVIISAQVLTAPEGALIIIDEPERHLHRSVIVPLLQQLFKKRSDCAFIVSTHETQLPTDKDNSIIILVRSCIYKNHRAEWNLDKVSTTEDVDDSLLSDILGGRKKIIFVEGISGRSLDESLYSMLFPGVSVVSKSNCREVENSVKVIRASGNFHWLNVFGIVDRDARSNDDVERLRGEGVYAVPAYSIESIYYHTEIQRQVATRHAEVTGGNSGDMLDAAKTSAVAAISANSSSLIRKVAEKEVRAKIYSQMPVRSQMDSGAQVEITISIADVLSEERSRFDTMVANSDLESLTARYPIRESGALSKIAIELGFQGRQQYESAVLKLLKDDSAALSFVRNLFGDLCSDLTE